ncbi:Phage-related tail protein [Nostoc flagelliforme CCNUN1]|uniref:Phage-related tail protein n=1 Tax=Nostoc flagelliforme CCNUN1 TaxID=2038116 RepID=A0A2K8SLB8_9NOSO|nr:phage tail tape measure protein [Nostoc flagelliforme]AUB36150.1 Phage-related tail protein [Nostoc flagelliforme CCNUN1]
MSLVGSAEVRVALNRAQLERDVTQVETLIRNLGTRQAVIQLNATSARQALADITTRAERLAGQISRAQAVGVDTRAARERLEELARLSERIGNRIRQQESLNINSSRARQELTELRQQAERLSGRIREANRVSVDTSGARRALQLLGEEAQRTTRDLGQGLIKGLSGVESFESLGRGIGQNIGSGIRQGLTSAISSVVDTTRNIIGSSLNASRQFSGSIRSFAALSGDDPNSAAIKGVREEVEKLAIATTKTPQQIAGAAIELTKLGFGAKETKKELAGLVQLSEATGSSIEKAASIVGATNNVFQRSAKDIADIVAATANSTAADANDFLQAVSKAGGVAKSNNQDLETLATAFGLIRNAGFEAEAAATAVKTAINRLAAPNPKGQEALTQLGVQIRDETTKEMRNLIQLVPDFRAALGKVDPGTRSKLTKTIFGDEGGPAFLALLATSQEKIDSTYQTIRNSSGRAAETSEKLVKGLDGELKRFEGSVGLLQVRLGDAFAPAAESVVAFGNKVTNNLLTTEGLFGSITSAAQEFGDELANNSELAEQVESALGLAIEELSKQGITIIKEFTETLRENPRLLADMVSGTAELVKFLAQAAKFVTDIASGLSAGKRELDILYSVGGTEGEGSRQAIRGMGGTQQEVSEFDKELEKRLTAANLPTQDFGIIGPARGRYDKIVGDTAAVFQDRIIARNREQQKQKATEDAAAQSDAARIPTLAASAKAAATEAAKPPVVKAAQTTAKDALKQEASAASKAKAGIDSREAAGILSVKQSQLKGDIDPEQAQEKITKIQTKANQEELVAQQEHLKRLQGLKAKGVIDSAKYGEEELKSTKQISTLKAQILEAELKERDNNNRRILENLDRANKQATAAIAASASARILIVKQQLANQEITEKQAAERILKIHQDITASDIQLLNKQLADVDKLEKSKVITAKQATDKRIELQSQLAAKNQELVDQEIEGQKRIRDEAIQTIDDRIAGDKRRSDAAITNLDAEQKRLVDFAQKADEITKSLIESRAGLDKAVTDAELNSGQIAIDRTNRALDARKQADEKDIEPKVKGRLEGEIKRLGFKSGDTELDILAKRQEQEDKLAQTKLKALEQEQKLKRALEEQDIRRLQYAEKQADIEARKGLLAAKQAQNEAKGALSTAEALAPGKERDNAIANAKEQIAISSEGTKLAEEAVGLAKDQTAAVKEIVESKREALKIDQQSAREQFNAAEEARKSAQREESAQAISRNPDAYIPKYLINNQGDGIKASAPTGGDSELYLPPKSKSKNDPAYAVPQKTNSLRDQLEMQPDKSFLEKYLPPPNTKAGDILEQSKGAIPQNQAGLFFDSAPIVAEIQKLNSNITALASRPTTLQVSSPTPVTTDALQEGTDITGTSMPAGGTSGRGWLSAIWKLLSDRFPASVNGKIPVTTDALQEGTDINSAVMPAGGASGRGWLSAIWKLLSDRLMPAGTLASYLGNSNGATLKVTPGTIYAFTCSNNNSVVRYFQIFDKSTPPTSGDIPIIQFPTGTNDALLIIGQDILGGAGITLPTAVSWGFSSTRLVYTPATASDCSATVRWS